MGGRRLLKCGAPRLLSRADGSEGYAYRRAYAALQASFGPFTSELVRLEAGRVAMAWLQYTAATQALTAAQRARRAGKGRRPNAQQIERLARRQGRADGTYSAALAQLQVLARNGHGHAADPLAAVQRAVEEANQR